MPAGMDEKIRTFIAVEVPDDIKAAMKDVQVALRKTGADVKWVRPEGVHLTLKFLGGIDAGLIDKLGAAITDAVKGVAPFEMEVKGTGVFPAKKSPRVVWLGLAGDTDALDALYDAVESACMTVGFEREKRPFSPHLTLGRVRSPRDRQSLVDAIAENEKLEPGSFKVDAVSVMKSELRPAGAVYTELRRIGLGG